ncbi:MAG: hypothetical protein EA404_00270 [Spirochaetaceae bacterium]|nr:MAG: hypothetical protein EA404_00270 [Spirochaetaceae bacterium]
MFEIVEVFVTPGRTLVFHKMTEGNEVHGLVTKPGDRSSLKALFKADAVDSGEYFDPYGREAHPHN